MLHVKYEIIKIQEFTFNEKILLKLFADKIFISNKNISIEQNVMYLSLKIVTGILKW